jgi:hypothetical protein
MAYTVVINENSHYMDKDESYTHGEFETLDAAIEACKKIVDEYLASEYSSGMSAKDLYSSYMMFGEDPWISGVEGRPFSAWKYAEQRCTEICS